MISPMDWIEILLMMAGFLVAITAVIIGNKIQLQAHKEATAQQLDTMAKAHRREMELLQIEAKECRERIDNLLTLMARHRTPEKD